MLLHAYAGYLAGLATACLWALTSVLFTGATRRLGPVAVNTYRLCAAVVLQGLTHLTLSGRWWPEASAGQVGYLALSGLVGLTLGDQALFQAFADIGPRLSVLVMTTAPIFAAILGLLVLGEALSLLSLAGMAVTIAGVVWVVLERPPRAGPHASQPAFARGVTLAVVAAACQAGGLLLSKLGIGHGWRPAEMHLNPQAASLIRMVFAAATVLPIFAVWWRFARPMAASTEARGRLGVGLTLATAGAVAGPFLGVWLSLVASDRAPLGVAQTLLSLTPIAILPFSIWLYRERLTVRAVLGALVAVGGCVLLFAGR